jgi:hypothetical protein
MRIRGLASLAVLLPCVACSGPAVLSTRTELTFHLDELRGTSVAIWPIGSLHLLGSVPQTVADEYQTPDRFAEQLSQRLGAAVMPHVKEGSLQPADVVKAFGSKDLRHLLTPPPKTNGTIDDAGLGFTDETLAAYVRKLRSQAVLKDVRYVILPHDLNVARGWSRMRNAAGGGSSTSADTTARLRVVVLDVPHGKVVWEGKVIASESSTFMKVKALHDVEKGLVTHFSNAVRGVIDTL